MPSLIFLFDFTLQTNYDIKIYEQCSNTFTNNRRQSSEQILHLDNIYKFLCPKIHLYVATTIPVQSCFKQSVKSNLIRQSSFTFVQPHLFKGNSTLQLLIIHAPRRHNLILGKSLKSNDSHVWWPSRNPWLPFSGDTNSQGDAL